MTLISTIRINQTSPYDVKIIDDGLSLGFTTEKGIHYKIAFTEDCSIFPHNAYMFYIGAQDMPLLRTHPEIEQICNQFNQYINELRNK